MAEPTPKVVDVTVVEGEHPYESEVSEAKNKSETATKNDRRDARKHDCDYFSHPMVHVGDVLREAEDIVSERGHQHVQHTVGSKVLLDEVDVQYSSKSGVFTVGTLFTPGFLRGIIGLHCLCVIYYAAPLAEIGIIERCLTFKSFSPRHNAYPIEIVVRHNTVVSQKGDERRTNIAASSSAGRPSFRCGIFAEDEGYS
uniref:Uncharacterized protein n=1 Tax=Parascaris equorum TaxID=6256 RepID=A0A914RGJ9_PAREQ